MNNNSYKLIVLIAAMTITIIFLILIMFTSFSGKNFALVETVYPENILNSESRPKLLLNFSHPLPLKQSEDFSIDVFPETKFTYGIDEKTLIISFDKIMLGDTVYSVDIKNITDINGTVIPLLNEKVELRFSEKSKSFIDSLPFDGKGVVIMRISEDNLFFLSSTLPETVGHEEGYAILEQNDLNASLFYIGKNTPVDGDEDGDEILIPH